MTSDNGEKGESVVRQTLARLRSINGLISGQLKSDMGIGAADLGLVTSVYFLVLAAAQVPIGSLLDRFGPRRIQGGLLLVAALGAALFA